MTVSNITESMTNPGIATTIGGTTILANFAGNLPIIINVIVAVYFTLMVIHKVYQMCKEYKADNPNEPGK